MNNNLGLDSVNVSKVIDTNLVTPTFLNTHCIVCGRPFQVARMSKLYCSARCKQFGYNHKNQISQVLATRDKGINPKPIVFSIEDFNLYDKTQKRLRRYRELKKKETNCEMAEQEIKLKQKLGVPESNFLWQSYTSQKLTESEDFELYNCEQELPEEVMDLELKQLSLEQWSFIKSLHPFLDELAFFELVASLSKEFVGQLNLKENTNSGNSEYLIIKNKFVNHCNLIAMGVIKFEKKSKTNEP